ncbi:TetR family transcriptional regulator [Williamsia sp. MIQD14]|uniref:TetR/AcrR family transcriptional regulator n=1 Tax=Williamsia sp. MIQD14 TaxID=3425703 RepID=UPI003D9FD7CE
MSDLTARARVRDAAIAVWARDGFVASVRTIAEEAGVSPGLVIHHFGSKEGLRAECDAHVADVTRERNRAALADAERGATAVGDQLAGLADAGPSLMYLVRSVADGGEFARSFIARLVADTQESMRIGVAGGVIRPSVDEAARAHHLVAQSLGAMLVDLTVHPPADHADSAAIVRDHVQRTMVPAAEYATHGVLTDTSMFEAVLAHRRAER